MLAKKIFEMTIGFHLWLILSFTKQEEKAKVELEALGLVLKEYPSLESVCKDQVSIVFFFSFGMRSLRRSLSGLLAESVITEQRLP